MTVSLIESCARCERPVSTGPYDADEYEIVVSGPWMTYVCADCVTNHDSRAVWEDDQVYGAALDAAGLCADNAVLEAMSDAEQEARERLALVIYHRNRNPDSQVLARTRVL